MTYLALSLGCTSRPKPFAIDDQSAPRPVVLSAVQWDDKEIFAQCACYIRQEDQSMSASAQKLYGVSDRTAKSRGVAERTALAWITNSLKSATHLVGWSLSYDLDVIRAALIRHGGDHAKLIRPGLIKIGLQQICAVRVGDQDENGSDIMPSIERTRIAMGMGSVDLPQGMIGPAVACKELFTLMCDNGEIPDMEN